MREELGRDGPGKMVLGVLIGVFGDSSGGSRSGSFSPFSGSSRSAVRIRVGRVHITALRSADVGDDGLPILLDSAGGKLRAEVQRL
jgi:hypothetical protein